MYNTIYFQHNKGASEREEQNGEDCAQSFRQLCYKQVEQKNRGLMGRAKEVFGFVFRAAEYVRVLWGVTERTGETC